MKLGRDSRQWHAVRAGEVCLAALLYLLAPIAAAQPRSGAPSKPSEYQVEAAYLFDFGKFIRLNGPPRPSQGDFDICILGRDPIVGAMEAIADGGSIDGRPVRVLRIDSAAQAKNCNIVFVSAYEGDAIHGELEFLDRHDELTVGDAPDFLERGGMIQFVLLRDHVRFEVNLDAVHRTHLALSSELLRVATRVEGKPSGMPR